MKTWLLAGVVIFTLILGSSLAYAQTGGDYNLTWWTVDSGGGAISGGSYQLYSTVGQPDAREAIPSTKYTLENGFWPLDTIVSWNYLPIILKAPLPDLVGTFTINPSSPVGQEQVEVTVVITNQGTIAASAFWVDFYINPSTTPTVNQRWDSICGISPCNGIAWFVPGGLLPGNFITLTSNSYDTGQSRWPGYFVAGTTDLFIYVDSWNPGVFTGGVFESNEGNNSDYLGGLTVSGLEVGGQSVSGPNLPPRPAPADYVPQTIKPTPTSQPTAGDPTFAPTLTPTEVPATATPTLTPTISIDPTATPTFTSTAQPVFTTTPAVTETATLQPTLPLTPTAPVPESPPAEETPTPTSQPASTAEPSPTPESADESAVSPEETDPSGNE